MPKDKVISTWTNSSVLSRLDKITKLMPGSTRIELLKLELAKIQNGTLKKKTKPRERIIQ